MKGRFKRFYLVAALDFVPHWTVQRHTHVVLVGDPVRCLHLKATSVCFHNVKSLKCCSADFFPREKSLVLPRLATTLPEHFYRTSARLRATNLGNVCLRRFTILFVGTKKTGSRKGGFSKLVEKTATHISLISNNRTSRNTIQINFPSFSNSEETFTSQMWFQIQRCKLRYKTDCFLSSKITA